MEIAYLHRTQGAFVEGVHIWEIVRAFARAGHTTRVFGPGGEQQMETASPGQDRTPARPSAARRFFALVSRHSPQFLFELFELGSNGLALFYLWRANRKRQFDLIFERYAINGVAGALFARVIGVPWVLEVNYHAASPMVRPRTRFLRPMSKSLDRWLFRQANLIIVVSSKLKEEMKRQFGVPDDRLLVLPNAADLAKFSLETKPIVEVAGRSLAGKQVIGFVGGFFPWHGLDFLLKAFVPLADRFPNACLLLIGDGPMMEPVAQIAAREGLTERVIFAGRVAHDDLARYVQAFDVGVLPDTNDYGSPMKIFEYMAMAKPVIAPDYPPVRDVLVPDESGLIFPRRDAQGLTESLARLLGDQVTARAMGQAGRRAIQTTYNWGRNGERILEAIADGDSCQKAERG